MNLRLILFALVAAATAFGQSSHLLTYQGRLNAAGTNFHGLGQFKFAIVSADGLTTYWRNDGSGSPSGEPVAAVTLPVNEGLFTARLGDVTTSNMTAIPTEVFTHADLRLRIWFRQGSEAFTALAPAQPLTAAPYAMMAAQASNVVGVLPASALGGTYGSGVSFTNGANVFAGDGAGLANLNGGALTGPGAVSRLSRTNLAVMFFGDSRMRITVGNNMLAVAILTNTFFNGRVQWSSNYAMDGTQLYLTNHSGLAAWGQYTNLARPSALAQRALGREVYAVIVTGANDPDRRPAEWTANFDGFLAALNADGVLPVVTTVAPRADSWWLTPGGVLDVWWWERNDYIRRMEPRRWVACADVAAYFTNPFDTRYYSDTVHHTEAGILEYARLINSALFAGKNVVFPHQPFLDTAWQRAVRLPAGRETTNTSWVYGGFAFIDSGGTNHANITAGSNTLQSAHPGSIRLDLNGGAPWLKTTGSNTNGWARLAIAQPDRSTEWCSRLPLRYAPLISGFNHDARGPAKPDGDGYISLEDVVRATPNEVCALGWPTPSNLRSNLLTEFVLTVGPGATNVGLKIRSTAQVLTNFSRVGMTNITTAVSLTNGHLTRVPISTPLLPGDFVRSVRHEFYSLSGGPVTNEFWILDCNARAPLQ